MPKRTTAQQKLIDKLSVSDTPHRIGVAMREVRRGAADSLLMQEIVRAGLTPGQLFDALGILVIDHPNGCRMTELAFALRVDASTATRAVDRLVRRGLAVRARSEEDGRAFIVEATPEGVERYLAAVAATSPLMRSTFDAALSKAEQATLADLLGRLVIAFDLRRTSDSPDL